MFEKRKRLLKTMIRSKSVMTGTLTRVAGKTLRALFIFGLSYLFLFPLFYMISTSFQSVNSINDPSVIWIPKEISFKGITGAIEFLSYWKSLKLTGTITVFSSIGSIISCALVGYGFARFKFPLKNFAFALVLLTIIVPPQTLIMSNFVNYWFFDFGGILSIFGVQWNLLNTPWVFVLPSMFATGIRAGLYVYIFRQFFKGIPKELEEAAIVDGCGVFKTFLKIMVPLAIPAFITVLLFSSIWHWNEFYSSSMYFTTAVKPISVMLNNLQNALYMGGEIGFNKNPYEVRMYLQAGALLSILPPLLLYVFTQKFFTESIERTGIVG